jgi:hypothetical protein
MRRLKGASLETILKAVEAATAEDDRHILEAIAEQVQDYADRGPPSILPGGKTEPPEHGFVD